MRGRVVLSGLVLLLCLALGSWWWRAGRATVRRAGTSAANAVTAPTLQTLPHASATKSTQAASSASKLSAIDHAHYVVSNTREPESRLLRNDHAILLANALIDTTRPAGDLNIPDRLRAPADNGSWIVQARGPLDAPFRSLLAGAGAQVVSYIPNDAELVLASGAVAQELAASPLVAAVLPYEPYYKLTDPALLKLAVDGTEDLPPDVGLRLGVFTGMQDATVAALKGLGAEVADAGPSPFGEILNVHPAAGTFVDVARLPGVMVVEAMHGRVSANDLTRVRLGVSVNTVTNADYLSLSGLGVYVNVNDSGVDATHPDFQGPSGLRVSGDALTDTNGHGTHVIGTILGNGSESATVGTNASGSVTNANFRGMATNAQALVIGMGFDTRPQAGGGSPPSDAYVQETAGRTNTFISNNSWDYDGDAQYDMAAASYDQAVRDAVPEWTGPQAVLYVFAAGNSGGAGTGGTGGISDTILSPGTAKNVITVGAIEAFRNITNKDVVDNSTNTPWLSATDSSNQVASFSSRGNVGVGIEGPTGRFKPDVVAPGTFVLSDKANSNMWNQMAYYNPTNYTYNTLYNQSVTNGGLEPYSIFLPANAVFFSVSVVTNKFSPELSLVTNLPVYIGLNDNPATNAGGYDAMGTGSVTLTLTSTPPLPPASQIFYSVGDATNGFVSYDVQTLVETTNDNGNYLVVLSNLNASLGPYYRYESGTSMAAAGVSGTLALMQEFFEQRLHLTNHSPALMKALLINGARTVSSAYDFNVNGALTAQGWGLPNLANSVPGAITNGGPNLPLQFFDQTTNMLATGQSKTRTLKLATGAGSQPLRVTLVWTDPPGNPAAGVKLVNNLDLVVSNLDNHTVFYGNDIPAGSDYNESHPVTNSPPVLDSVNNVQNVYLFPPLNTNYSITVNGTRVNVNAVDSNNTSVVQDYALVVSYGDAGVFSNAFTLTDVALVSSNGAAVGAVTNGIPLLNQRVGGNAQYTYTYTNTPYTTNGTINQWQFYVYTNTPSLTNAAYTNVAFVIFDPVNLGVPIMGVRQEANPANGVRVSADADLYVSTDPTLTNLNTLAVNAAYQSLSRTGTQKVLLGNQPKGQVYYIGVKAEDQEGAQYGFVGVALTNSFGQVDSNGNVVLTLLTQLPAAIPPGTPSMPGSVTVMGFTTDNVQARKVVVADTVTHQEFGDLVGVIGHGSKTVVLNNHSFFANLNDQTETFLYDDTGEVGDQYILNGNNQYVPPFSLLSPPPNTAGPQHSDGPGTLTTFVGDNASDGIWTFSMVNDSSPNDVGSIDNLTVFIEPQQITNGFTNVDLPADSWYYGFVDVPADATNLTINVYINTTNVAAEPVDLYVRRGAFPDANDYDKFALISPPGGTMTLSIYDSPPLNAGTYYIGVFNPNSSPQTVSALWFLGLSPTAGQPLTVVSAGSEPILDDAVTYSTNYVGENSTVVSAEVGVRIVHPRESDLVLTLIDPQGTRVLLAENRGGLDTNGYGNGTNITNYIGSVTSGTNTPSYNVLTSVTANSGTLIIPYNFYTVPDDMRIYYGTTRIFDSGLISGAGTFSVDFGPGASTNLLTIAMDEAGTNPSGTNGDLWTYQVIEITKNVAYAIFTENTNETTTPIKFAIPPFGGGPLYLPTTTSNISTFETSAPGTYVAPGTVDGWTVTSNAPVIPLPGGVAVQVVTVTALAANEGNAIEGSNILALHYGSIMRELTTTPGTTYTLSFVSHGPPAAGPYDNGNPAGWWKGEGGANDASGNLNNGTVIGGQTYPPGEVGQAFSFNGTSQYVEVLQPPANLNVGTNIGLTIEGWIQPADLRTNEPLTEWNDGGNVGKTDLGPHFWINQPTASDGGGPGSLFANVVDNQGTGNWHTINSGPGLLSTTAFQHVAVTYDEASGNANLYWNGTVVALTNFGSSFTPRTAAPYNLYLGHRPNTGSYPTESYPGLMDEMTLYSNALSILQIQDVYAAGSAGKCPVSGYVPVSANVILAGQTNVITGYDYWSTNIYTFTAVSNTTVLEIQPLGNGMLVDSFQMTTAPVVNPANYYLPEESLGALTGQKSQGNWKLEMWDNRLGATNPAPTLLSWQLSLVLARVNPTAIALTDLIPNTNCVPPESIAYYVVNVPPWAQFATNILTATNGPLSLLFNQNFLPGTTNGDVTLLPNPPGTGGTFVMATTNTVPNTTPVLLPGQEYYLGVSNASSTATVCFTIEVDFNITTLTNLVPVTNTLAATTEPYYYQYDVSSNAQAVAFLLYNLSGSAELVARRGPPLPTATSYDYQSANQGTNDDIIIISSNSTPVVLTPGWWYLGVYNTGTTTNALNYTIEAAELVPTIIPLTNDERFTTNFSALASQDTFFSFDITNSPAGALFELYNMNTNADLTLDFETLPFSAPFFMESANPGTNGQQIVIRTNQLGTNITGLWYLGVPNQTSGNVTFTIHAVVTDTNGLLVSAIPIAPVVTVPIGGVTGPTLTWATVVGECYNVFYATNLASPLVWTPLPGSPFQASGPTTSATDSTPITGIPFMFYQIVQTNCP